MTIEKSAAEISKMKMSLNQINTKGYYGIAIDSPSYLSEESILPFP